jgi:hypothetical protein
MSDVTERRIVAGALISMAWSVVLLTTLALTYVLNQQRDAVG